jgi:hypothetical protein
MSVCLQYNLQIKCVFCRKNLIRRRIIRSAEDYFEDELGMEYRAADCRFVSRFST